MATYVVGDLHGQLSLLELLLQSLSFDRENDRLIAAGDVIDRGGEVGDLLLFLFDGFREGWFIPVMGNHEESFLRHGLGDPVPEYTDPSFGGSVTLRALDRLGKSRRDDLREWIRGWPLVWGNEEAIVVHGSLPSLPGSDYGDIALCSTRVFPYSQAHECLELRPPNLYPSWDGRLVVSGHTIVKKARFWSDSIALVDTGGYRTGILSAMCLETRAFHRVSGFPS